MNKVIGKVKNMVDFYSKKRISRASAALSYFITLSFFPFLICLNAILADIGITLIEVLDDAKGVIPLEAIDVIKSYLTYVAGNESEVMIIAGVITMITTSAAGFRALMQSIYDCVGEARYTGAAGFFISFLLSVGFIAVLYLGGIIMITGQWLFQTIYNVLDVKFINILIFSHSWKWVRFVILFLLLYLMITSLYSVAIRQGKKVKYVLNLGAFITAAVLVAVSIIFSLAIELSSNYTLVYGSLASVIILMLWLYVCGNILIIGSALCSYFAGREIGERP